MTDTTIVSTVRARRAAAGVSQSDLAERAGVSRQALSAIEAGRQVPSTALALQLARALRCSVDDLFSLPGGSVVRARMAAAPSGPRVVLGRVDGSLVAHPAVGDFRSADGVVLGDARRDEAATVELLGELAAIEANVLVAGCAPLLGMLTDRVGRRFADARATWIPANSGRALELLAGGSVHVAGIHLADATDPEAHERAVRSTLPGTRTALVTLARWRQGLVVAKGNPLGIRVDSDLLRPELRWVRRDEGAGAQKLLDRILRDVAGGAVELPADAPIAYGHSEVAQRVRWGVADVGVAIESAALDAGLDFIPLSEERVDLVVPETRLASPTVGRFFELVDERAFRAEARGLPGYDLSSAGHVATVGAR